jgi:hypothetical protein
LDNSSISTVLLQPVTLVNNAQISISDSNDDSIISDADANAWALSLSLVSAVDGSGSEYESKLLFNLSVYNKIDLLCLLSL